MTRHSSVASAVHGGHAHEFAAATTATGPSAVTIPPRPVHRSAHDELAARLHAALGRFQEDEDGQPRQLSSQEREALPLATAERVLAVALDHGRRHGPLSVDDLTSASSTAGRVYAPRITCDLWSLNLLEPQAITAGVPTAWCACELPEFGSPVSRRRWLEMFAAAGFTVNGQPADRPPGTVTLYRGATHARRRGMSWSTDLDVARHFASGALLGRMPGQVYRLEAPWSAVLAVINDNAEGEHVVDTRGLKIAAAAGGVA